MPEETTTTINEVKATSDGNVKLSVEKYNDLLETIADQKVSIGRLNEQLTRARNEPPIINRTVVHKTDEMVAKDYRMWGGGLMGLGATMFVVGALCYKAGLK